MLPQIAKLHSLCHIDRMGDISIFFRDPSSLRSVGMTSIGHPWLNCHIFYFFYKIREYFLDLCAACAYNGCKGNNDNGRQRHNRKV